MMWRGAAAALVVATSLLGARGCQSATAQAPAPELVLDRVLRPPVAWIELPETAAAARAAASVDARAWGDPGRGCYAVVIGARSPRENPEDALGQFSRRLDPLGLTGWTTTGTDGTGELAHGDVTGRVRASAIAAGSGAAVIAAACFSNPREPATCAARCQGVLASFDVSKVIP